MQLNAFYPTRDIGRDPAKIRDWAQAAEDLGYAYIEVPDHVFGTTPRDGCKIACNIDPLRGRFASNSDPL
jgi:alkanesulfonate monooxygenase SsuD/methylene tetrahydromethanopterin reductase-like flavin-dependent oxidoreductase (luciferase family)